jgi:hypothetical protein
MKQDFVDCQNLWTAGPFVLFPMQAGGAIGGGC